jgi:hypothetical protein
VGQEVVVRAGVARVTEEGVMVQERRERVVAVEMALEMVQRQAEMVAETGAGMVAVMVAGNAEAESTEEKAAVVVEVQMGEGGRERYLVEMGKGKRGKVGKVALAAGETAAAALEEAGKAVVVQVVVATGKEEVE